MSSKGEKVPAALVALVESTAQDITLQELRIECFHPANESTRLSACALMEACEAERQGSLAPTET